MATRKTPAKPEQESTITLDTSLLKDVPESVKSFQELSQWTRSTQVTPLEIVEAREGHDATLYFYIRHEYLTLMLDKFFGHNWDWRVNRAVHAPVDGKDHLTVYGEGVFRLGGEAVTRGAFGSFVRRSKMEMGHAHMAAASVALRKMAERMSIGLDMKLPISDATRKHMHAVGSTLYKDEWDERRRLHVRTLNGDYTSSMDLLDIEARIYTNYMEAVLEQIKTKKAPRLLQPVRAFAEHVFSKLKK